MVYLVRRQKVIMEFRVNRALLPASSCGSVIASIFLASNPECRESPESLAGLAVLCLTFYPGIVSQDRERV